MTGKHFLYFHGLKRTLVQVGTLRRFAVYYIRMRVAGTEYLVRSRSLTGAGATKAKEIKADELGDVEWLEASKAVTYARNLAIAKIDAIIKEDRARIEFCERSGKDLRQRFRRLGAGETMPCIDAHGDTYMEERMTPGQVVTDETETIEAEERWLVGRWVSEGWKPRAPYYRVPLQFAAAAAYRGKLQKLEALRDRMGDG